MHLVYCSLPDLYQVYIQVYVYVRENMFVFTKNRIWCLFVHEHYLRVVSYLRYE